MAAAMASAPELISSKNCKLVLKYFIVSDYKSVPKIIDSWLEVLDEKCIDRRRELEKVKKEILDRIEKRARRQSAQQMESPEL